MPRPAKAKRKLSAAGRKAISEATKKRWALKRAAEGTKVTSEQKTVSRKAAVKKAAKKKAPVKKAVEKATAKRTPPSPAQATV
jgi:hypothetical protein